MQRFEEWLQARKGSLQARRPSSFFFQEGRNEGYSGHRSKTCGMKTC